ncbi:hypothetical protein [Paenarthrobacter nitroguajacolicus]|uniref:hypothetical protein n=1 Tax=Paenarthrobacter nitroguajacolicus TaxID=211146 RepID=UPI0028639F59|nr:hypothetical protein [Paenarthrobacter nitroguajacolicus]MDR6636657.1 hypothetical protein [Paenarthrobacter nitroguajacolicus]
MTSQTLLRLLRKRWYVAFAVILLGLAGLGAIRAQEPVYWAQTEVSFVAPNSDPAYWIPGGDNAVLVPFAALVERRVNADSDSVDLVLARGTLYGAGVKQGYSVTLPNAGGQWAKSFTRPVLLVQVVDSSAENVNRVLSAVIDRINAACGALQKEMHVDSRLIFTVSTPSSPEIIFGGGTQVDRLKGAAIWLTLFAGAALAVTYTVDRRLTRRRGTTEEVIRHDAKPATRRHPATPAR